MLRSKALSGLGVGLFVLAVAGCGSSSNSSGGGGGSSNVSCTPGPTSICVEPDPTNTGKYNLASAQVKTATQVTWTFTDQSAQHTVTFDDGSFDSGTKSAGDTASTTISKPAGTKIPYHCTLHANMKGDITVQ